VRDLQLSADGLHKQGNIHVSALQEDIAAAAGDSDWEAVARL